MSELHPFSTGLRACLGKGVAWVEGRLIVAKLLWSVDMAMVPGQKIDLEKDLKTYGFWVKPDVRIKFAEGKRV